MPKKSDGNRMRVTVVADDEGEVGIGRIAVGAPARETALSAALACQKETSLLHTTPFMRGDSQQAHCFRF